MNSLEKRQRLQSKSTITKRQKVAWPCRVCSKDCTMQQESIQCDGCECWLHQVCVNMSVLQYMKLSADPTLQYFCRQCSSDADGRYNYLAALARIASHSPDVGRMRQQADSECR